MNFLPTFDDAARSSFPVGVECATCLRRGLLSQAHLGARAGDMRQIELHLKCSSCGESNSGALVFDADFEAQNFASG